MSSSVTSVTTSHERDTPVSQESPAKLITPFKEDEIVQIDQRSSSPAVNGDSTSGSSEASTSPLRLSSPGNGLLTPPTDGDNGSDKPDTPGGRLKFYKDGILCLELSHHNEGEKTKWVQIRTKTVFPTVVHATKEATIPCHISPTSFTSPSLNPLQSRMESSTSHSMSDDGSSMLSSPRAREIIWKQPVPQKSISSCLEFFMNPAVCVFNLRRIIRNASKSQILRKLFLHCRSDHQFSSVELFSICDSKSVVCSCKTVRNVVELEDKQVESDDRIDSSESKGDKTEKKSALTIIDVANMTDNILTKRVNKSGYTCKFSIISVCDRLKTERELQVKEELENSTKVLLNNNCSDDTKVSSAKNQVTLPKKRVFKEVEPRDFRPKKKSPNSNKVVHDTRTILNVPGLNSEFYRRHSSQQVDGFEGQKLPHNMSLVEGKSTSFSIKKNSKVGKNGIPLTRKNENSNSSPYNCGAKSSSSPTRGTSRKTIELDHDSKVLNNQIPYPISSAMCLSSLPLQQQEQFLQRQTMSKAISYTINSLLSNPGSSESSVANKNSLLKPNLEAPHSLVTKPSISERSNGGKSGKNKSNVSSHCQQEILPGLFGIKSEQDQNSFLRHLLDTSDPIPSSSLDKPEKIEKVSHKKTPSSPSNRNQSKTNSSDSRSSSGSDVKKNPPASTKPVSQSSKTLTKSNNKNNNNSHSFAHYPHPLHPSLVNSGFPLSLGAYDAFLRGQQDHSSAALAAAAAAAFQYQALLPGLSPNMLSNLNSTMAAAMAATYLGGTPNTTHAPISSSSLRSPPVHPQTTTQINYSSSNSSPLNLSQRAWPGMTNGFIQGSGPIPVPFHAPDGDNRHSDGRSSMAYSRERMEKSLETIDSDTPLNLSKKPRSN